MAATLSASPARARIVKTNICSIATLEFVMPAQRPAPIDLQRIQQWSLSAKPVFICGLARSGTSMLQVALARHSAMYNIKNCRETHIFVRPRTPLEDPIHRPTQLYLQGRKTLLGFRQWVQQHADAGKPLSEAELIRCFFWYASHTVYPGRQPLEKTPAHIKQIPLIFELFPKAKVLVCSREPLEVCASYRKRLQRALEEGRQRTDLRWLDKNVPQMIDVFERFTHHVTAARPQYGKAMFMAPYEWLVTNPEQSLRDICEFADLPFEPGMLRAHADEVVDDSEDCPAPALQIVKRESEVSKYLDPDEIAAISLATEPWMPLWRQAGVLCP